MNNEVDALKTEKVSIIDGITVDYSRDELFDKLGMLRLRSSYMREDEVSPQERYVHVANTFGSNPAHAQRLYDYASKHWLSMATPILSYGKSKNGLPISCYLSYIDDSAEGLVDNLSETNWLSMIGGGVGIGVGIRAADDKSVGIMPHLKTYDSCSLAYRQGKCYLPGTEILTANGWKLFESLLIGDIVASIEDDGSLVWEHPTELVDEEYSGTMINFINTNHGIDFSVTEDHSMVIERKLNVNGWSGNLIKVRASDLSTPGEARFLLSSVPGTIGTTNEILTPLEQLTIAFQANGYQSCEIESTAFQFSEIQKIEKMRDILEILTFEFTEHITADGAIKFYLKDYSGDKHLEWINLQNTSSSKANTILEEIAYWSENSNHSHSFTFKIEAVADMVQSLAVIAGRSSQKTSDNSDGTQQVVYIVHVGNNPYINLEDVNKREFEYTGKVYCCVVPSGKIVVRNGGVPLVCGNTRRGTYAAYLRIDHPDIMVFLEMRKPTGDQNMKCLNMHHGVIIPDTFMELIEKSMVDSDFDDSWDLIQPHNHQVTETVSAKELWQRLLELRMETGEPYILFIDTANKLLPDFQKRLGLLIQQSNICVAPETPLLTDTGYEVISSLENQITKVWNGENWSEVVVKKTGIAQELITVNFSDGSNFDVTPNHKFYIQEVLNLSVIETKAKDLVHGQRLEKFNLPKAYDSGAGLDDVDYYFQGVNFGDNENVHQIEVPINDTIVNKLNWFAGYADTVGSVAESTDGQSLLLGCDDRKMLHDVKLMLQTLGIYSELNIDGKFSWMDIGYLQILALLDLGFEPKQLVFWKEDILSDRVANFVCVESVVYNGRIDDTYCFTEEKRHRGVFNGILTGQCSEIILPTDKQRTAVCCLSSGNLRYYDDWSKDPMFIPDVMEMLDNVLDIFIRDAPEGIPRAVYSAMRERAVGFGVLGFHTYLQQNLIAFEGAMAKSVNRKIFSYIKSEVDAANIALGKKRGSCPDAIEGEHDVPRRFSRTMAIAPTASTSIIMGNISPSIEPIRANVYRQDTMSGSYTNKNHVLDALIKEKCAVNTKLDYEKIWGDIISKDGSIQDVDLFNENEKVVFKTAPEIEQRWIIELAGDRQKFIDQTQSVNLFFRPDVEVSYLHMVHFMAWKHGLPTLYYARSGKLKKADNISQQVERKIIEETTMEDLIAGEECLACQ